ncbi:MAG: gamma-glutamyl-gamma-aminobutyrate hydrolase family protein [Clostridiaceae bacterium]
MKKPLIGIVGNMLLNECTKLPGYEKVYINDDYVQAVHMAGGAPVILPLVSDVNTVIRQLEMLDGIVISGGYDVNPLIYGEEPTEKQESICPERDNYDLKIIQMALKLNKPILGICRGLQIINVALGGNLYQDLSQNDDCYIKHRQKFKPDVGGHTVEVVKDTRIHKILGDSILVNSIHHQAIKELAPGFMVAAKAKDGTIEAIEKEDGFVMAVQWHPEMMASKHPKMLEIFKLLVKESIKEG